jgi:hypothetical protein
MIPSQKKISRPADQSGNQKNLFGAQATVNIVSQEDQFRAPRLRKLDLIQRTARVSKRP